MTGAGQPGDAETVGRGDTGTRGCGGPRVSVSALHGVVAVDKPGGMTSHDVVNRARRIFGVRRIGHTGTLDPLATGVLVLCLGQATRIAEYLTGMPKEYRAGVTFGMTTDTEDVTGHIVSEVDASGLSEEQVTSALPRFRGVILQVPPMVSAVHHEGRRLYDLARQRIEVERQAREVEIDRLDLVSFTAGRRARAELEVECSTGTYVRTLAADLGEALGVGGTMESLVRMRVGPFRLADCHTLEGLQARRESGTAREVVRPISEALAGWPSVVLDEAEAQRVRHGQPLKRRSLLDPADRLVLLLSEDRFAIGIARVTESELRPIKVFDGSES